MQQVEVIEEFVSAHFPGATVAVVAGSTASGTRTSSSDIDLLLIGEEMLETGTGSHAATYAFAGEVFEVFAYTRAGFDEWASRGASAYRPVIVHMLLDGIPVRSDALLAELRDRWRPIIDAGPVIPPHELEARRYAITDLLDDLRDAADPLERHVIAFTLFQQTAELLLLSNRRWLGAGKQLPRRLREWNRQRAEHLAQPLLAGEFGAFADRAELELSSAGGRLQAGFIR